MKHREMQSAHEQSVLDSFRSYLETKGVSLQLLDRPDPPDAIVQIDGESGWIEITDAFQNTAIAKRFKTATIDNSEEQDYRMVAMYEPDREACERVKEVIFKKYDKNSMSDLLEQYGQGILLVGAYTPLTSPEDIIAQAGESILAQIAKKEPIFKSIYLYRKIDIGHVFTKLL